MRAGLLVCLLVFVQSAASEQQTPPAGDGQDAATIQVIEGDGAINSIRFRRGHDPVVRVMTSAGKPIRGAMVTFLAPATGPSGAFAGSGLSLTVQTDDRGIAAGRGFQPNGIAGQFRLRVITSWEGASATAFLVQTNAEPAIRSGRTKKIAIIAVIAAAAIGGAAAAAGGGSNDQSASTGGSAAVGGIVSGIPIIGPPE